MQDSTRLVTEAGEGDPARIPIAVIFAAIGPFAGCASVALAGGAMAVLDGSASWGFHSPGSFGEFGTEIAESLFGMFLLVPLIFMVGLIPAGLTGLIAALLSKVVTRPVIYVALCVTIGALVALVCLLPMGSEGSQMGAVAGAGGGLAGGFLTRHRERRAEAKPPTPAKD